MMEEKAFELSIQISREFPSDWRDGIVDRVLALKLAERYPEGDYQQLSEKGYRSVELRHLLGFWSYYEKKNPEWFGERAWGQPFTFEQVVRASRKVYRARLKM